MVCCARLDGAADVRNHAEALCKDNGNNRSEGDDGSFVGVMEYVACVLGYGRATAMHAALFARSIRAAAHCLETRAVGCSWRSWPEQRSKWQWLQHSHKCLETIALQLAPRLAFASHRGKVASVLG